MLRVKAGSEEMRFYGKTTKSEFAWFVIFGGLMGVGALVVVFHAILFNERGREVLFSSLESFLKIIGVVTLLAVPTAIILYWGYLLRSENVNGGKNAVKRFIKEYKKGRLPRLIEVAREGDDVEFRFYRGAFRAMISVYIPMRTFEKIREVMEGYRKVSDGAVIEFRNERGNRILLEGDEAEAYRFIEKLFKEQGDRIEKIYELRSKLESGEIDVWKYVQETMK